MNWKEFMKWKKTDTPTAVLGRLMSQTMGKGRLYTTHQVLIAAALISTVKSPDAKWTFSLISAISFNLVDAIKQARSQVLNSNIIGDLGPFIATDDHWEMWYGLPENGEFDKAQIVELLDPFDYQDCGAVVNSYAVPNLQLDLKSNAIKEVVELDKMNLFGLDGAFGCKAFWLRDSERELL